MVELLVSGGRGFIWVHAGFGLELGCGDGKTVCFLTIHQRVASSKAQLRVLVVAKLRGLHVGYHFDLSYRAAAAMKVLWIADCIGNRGLERAWARPSWANTVRLRSSYLCKGVSTAPAADRQTVVEGCL